MSVARMRRHARIAKKRRRLAMPESLEPRQMLDAMPILSEIMAAGGGDYADASGQTPDWIEIYNAGDHAVDLQGWFLTDRAGNLNKWEFPSGNLEPGEFLVVFASGNDQTDADGNLHTNFELSSGGEFIALVEPDGWTIASQLAGGFPQQFNETSFGVALSSDTTPLIESGAAATVLVPTILNGGDLLDDAWKGGAEPFDTAAWISGNTGIGFGATPSGDPPANLAPGGTASASSELAETFLASRAIDGNRSGVTDDLIFHTADPDTNAFYEVDLGQDYYLDRLQIFPQTNASQFSVENFRIDVFDSGGGNVFSDTYQASDSTRDKPWGTADVRNVLGQRVRLTRLDDVPSFLTFAEFEVYGGEAPIGTNLALGGTATGTDQRGDSLFEDAIDGDINGIFKQADTSGIGNPNNPVYHSFSKQIGNFWQVDLGSIETLAYANVFARTDFLGNASDVTFEVLADDGVTVNFSQDLELQGTDLGGQRYDTTVDLTGVDGRFVKITSNQGGGDFALALAEVEVFGESGGATNPDIQTDISSEMADFNTSAFMRIPFQVADPEGTDQLLLRMKYNDGFVAYINGQEVARRNAPQTLAWNSSATAPHSALAFEEITIFNAAALLNPGAGSDNILAITGLNTSATNPDFLMLPELFELVVETGGAPRYFPVPTPGFASGAVAENRGPAIFSLTELTASPDDAEDLVITSRVEQSSSPTAAVTLFYRVQFGAEVPVVMTDDGAGGDALAGDGIFTAVIPASASSPGDPVRWRTEATDADGDTSLWPMFADRLADTQSEQYFGTMIASPGVVSDLPILFWWAENPDAADSRTGTRGLVSYDGEFYDNVYIRDRGANTTPGNKFKLGDDHTFSYSDASARVSEFNVNGNGSDPAVIRPSLAFETYRAAGVAASESFLVLSQRNGVFQRVGIWIEQPDEIEFLERNNLDKDGTVYKLASGTTNPTFAAVNGAVQKKYPEDVADKSDIQGLFDGLNLQNEQDRREFLFDTFDVPAMINFLAARAFTQDIDSTRKNFYMFRDADTDEWSFFPWDNDWTFGVVGGGSPIVADRADEIASGNSNFEFSSHPLIGDATHKLYQVQYSLLHEVVQNVPETREMLLRRLRTLMDEMLQPPGTPLEERFFENRVDELFAPVAPHVSGAVADAVSQLKAYFERRRISLYQDHSIANTDDAAGIPDQQLAVPTIDFGSIQFNPVSGNQDEEYISLLNPNDTAVDISGWALTGGVEFTFRPGTVIPAGGVLYVSPDVNVFRARATGPGGGQGLFVQGGYAGHISNLGETINLLDGQGTQIATVNTPFIPSDVQQFLRITELHYNPAGVGDATEFIELRNTSSGAEAVTLVLTDVRITDGPSEPFDFTQSNVTSLAPGEYVLVVKDQAAFTAAYGGVDGAIIAGEFAGSLSNGGETIKIEDADNSTVVEFKYENGNNSLTEADWHAETDGDGFSLVVIDVAADYDSGTNWRSSAMLGGSPGGADPQPLLGNFNGDFAADRGDAVLLLANLGRSGNSHRARGDANDDRTTSLIDLALLQSGLGATHAAPAPLSSVEAVDAHFSRLAEGPSRESRTVRGSSRSRRILRTGQSVGSRPSHPSEAAVAAHRESQLAARLLRSRRAALRGRPESEFWLLARISG